MSYRKLERTNSQHKTLLCGLTTGLIVSGRITTTEARAREVREITGEMITLVKRSDLASRRKTAAFVRNAAADAKEDGNDTRVQSALQNLFEELAPKYADRNGGYTHILKTIPRHGDGAPMVILELVD